MLYLIAPLLESMSNNHFIIIINIISSGWPEGETRADYRYLENFLAKMIVAGGHHHIGVDGLLSLVRVDVGYGDLR